MTMNLRILFENIYHMAKKVTAGEVVYIGITSTSVLSWIMLIVEL